MHRRNLIAFAATTIAITTALVSPLALSQSGGTIKIAPHLQ